MSLSQHLGYTPPLLINWIAKDAQKIQQEQPILKKPRYRDTAGDSELIKHERWGTIPGRDRGIRYEISGLSDVIWIYPSCSTNQRYHSFTVNYQLANDTS